jgi:hypothetical protein
MQNGDSARATTLSRLSVPSIPGAQERRYVREHRFLFADGKSLRRQHVSCRAPFHPRPNRIELFENDAGPGVSYFSLCCSDSF